MIQDYCIAVYEREVERYGGEEIIDTVEQFFQVDSEISLSLIERKQKNPLPDYLLASISLIEILENGGLSFEEQISFFAQMDLNEKELEGFRKWKSPLLENIAELKKGESVFFPKELTEDRKSILKLLRGSVSNTEWQRMILSFCHMHCNRFLGTNQMLEQKAYLFARKGLMSLKELPQLHLEETTCLMH